MRLSSSPSIFSLYLFSVLSRIPFLTICGHLSSKKAIGYQAMKGPLAKHLDWRSNQYQLSPTPPPTEPNF
jgi:hypothetical protein